MIQALMIFLASLGVIDTPESNEPKTTEQQEVVAGDTAPTPDSDGDNEEPSKHSTKEGI